MAIIKSIDTTTFVPQGYSMGDENSLPTVTVTPNFNPPYGRVESMIYDLNGNQFRYDPNTNYAASTPGAKKGENYIDGVTIDPEKVLTEIGLTEGSYNVIFNFLNNELKSSYNQPFRIKEISSNRKEVRLTTAWLDKDELKEEVENFFPLDISSDYYPDFSLNFGDGNIYIATNMLFDDTNNQHSVLVKLYKPLPSFIQPNGGSNPWIVTQQRDSVGYNVEFEQVILPVKTTIDIKGPNFSLDLNNQVHSTIKPTSLTDLESSDSTTEYQLKNILGKKGIETNIDYTNLDNFVHFSSAERRVRNFYVKVDLIESLGNDLTTQSYYLSGSDDVNIKGYQVTKDKIENIIENFDGFEYWMYYTSESNDVFPSPYPKTTSTTPYTLSPTSSSDTLVWFNNFVVTASLYDSDNQDNLYNSIPEYVREDSDNAPYIKFVEMVSQHFDTLFTYAQDISNRYNADNRLDFGISKDLVGEAIKSMGINLYAGNFTAKDLASSFTSYNGYIPPQEDGNQSVNNYITSSAASGSLPPIEDVNKEIYKRIYHNLPLLLKQKGSIAGLRTLTNVFGIPNEILNVKEYNINYTFTTQSLPDVESSGQIEFVTQSAPSLPPTGSFSAPSEFLSPTTRVQQHFLVSSSTYDRSLQYIEAGFSPQNYLDKDEVLDKDLNNFYDFNTFYFGADPSKYEEKEGTGGWDTGAYIRYIKFFDTSLFQMIKDFTPARSSVATGFIWKPRLNDTRNRNRPAQLNYDNFTYSGSGVTQYYSWNSFVNREGITLNSGSVLRSIGDIGNKYLTSSFPGGTGGAFDDYNLLRFNPSETPQGGSDRAKLQTPITGVRQEWTDYLNAQSGSTFQIIRNDQSEFYNGDFRQSGLNGLMQPGFGADSQNGYFSKELPRKKDSFVPGQGSGMLSYNNNSQNLYKIPSTNKFESASVGHATTLDELNDLSNDIIYYRLSGFFAFQLILMNPATFGGKENLLQNGNTLVLQPTAGNYSGGNPIIPITVSSGLPSTVGGAEYIAFFLSGFEGFYEGLLQVTTEATYFSSTTTPDEFVTKQPWSYSDFNPLTGNAFDPAFAQDSYAGIRKGTYFMDADYTPSSTDPFSPINVTLVASGSASKAAVPDSNFTSHWWLNGRYEGSRISSPDFNQRIIKVIPEISNLFTSESLGFDPEASASDPIPPVTAPPSPAAG